MYMYRVGALNLRGPKIVCQRYCQKRITMTIHIEELKINKYNIITIIMSVLHSKERKKKKKKRVQFLFRIRGIERKK